MNVLDKVQVFKEIVFNKEKVPSFYRFCCTKMGHFALFAFLRGIFQCLWKTASLKQNLTYRKGKNDMVIHQYAWSYFVSRRHIFVILQKLSLLFRRNQLLRFTCTVQVITLGDIDGSVAERFRQWAVPLHAHWIFVMHAGRVRYTDVVLFFLVFI